MGSSVIAWQRHPAVGDLRLNYLILDRSKSEDE